MRLCLTLAWMSLAFSLAPSLVAQTTGDDLLRWRGWYREATTADGAATMAQRMAIERDTRADLANDPMAQGFLAVAELMIADHAWNPVDKLSQFIDWQPELEAALAARPGDPDLAFLRLGVQSHAPALLNYSSALQADRSFVEAGLASGHWREDPTHADFVRDFLLYLKSL
jgi:hypothetical protein